MCLSLAKDRETVVGLADVGPQDCVQEASPWLCSSSRSHLAQGQQGSTGRNWSHCIKADPCPLGSVLVSLPWLSPQCSLGFKYQVGSFHFRPLQGNCQSKSFEDCVVRNRPHRPSQWCQDALEIPILRHYGRGTSGSKPKKFK